MPRFIFVGERPSQRAHDNGWTWKDARLAGRTLFDALAACGVDGADCHFVNLFGDVPDAPLRITPTAAERARHLALHAAVNCPVVALGAKVATALAALGVEHVRLTHPAARGRIRAKALYIAHVRETLGTH